MIRISSGDTMRNAFSAQAPKKATNLSLNSELLAEAKRLNINLSATMEKALIQEVHERKKALIASTFCFSHSAFFRS